MDQVSRQHLKGNQLPPSHCIVLLSGGIDSAACVDFYQRQHFLVQGLHVTYGQPAAKQESVAASAIANYYRIPLTQISMIGARPKTETEFLGRNALLLFTALLELDARAAMLVLGVHSETPYYDCSCSFLSSIQVIVDGQCDGRVRVAAPFLDWTKKQIWQYCMEHRVPLELTYSCERGLDQPCGECLTCRDLEAIRAG
jgi:7-cyano-7-deazaguanine synthase